MNQLLPIIRRVRRPLLALDTPPMMVGNVEPVNLNAEVEASSSEQKLVNEVAGQRPATTGGTPVPPEDGAEQTLTVTPQGQEDGDESIPTTRKSRSAA